ncbi:MAG: hypothetical protein CEO22_604 [Candidatus Berkelbacteria bacterium Gr01-1014_85]|uniref:Uncharacterized protein n=1 Tax=Candidatus Berkelbacteria bacterium Gr01-1014_85 TaxID=2017150 RepID=A0A554J9T8_9BACT|nr:MAG: hypothetical protein CEO22_604 [Candidatus Berkelbacteria bacterium Gr01-1014_85]
MKLRGETTVSTAEPTRQEQVSRKDLRDFCNKQLFQELGFSVKYDPIFSRYTISTSEGEKNAGSVKFVSTGVPENGLFSKDQVPKAIDKAIEPNNAPEVIFALGIHLADSSLKTHRPDANQVELATNVDRPPLTLARNYLDTNTARRILGGDPTTATMSELIHSIREADAWGAVKTKAGNNLAVVKLTYDSDPYGIGATAVAMGLASLQKTRQAAEIKDNTAERNQTYARANQSADPVGTPRLYSNDLAAAPFDSTLPRQNEPMVMTTELTTTGEHRARLAYRELNPVDKPKTDGVPPSAPETTFSSDLRILRPGSKTETIPGENIEGSIGKSPEIQSFLAEDGLYRLASRHLAEVGNIARYAGERRFAPEDIRVSEIRLQQFGVLARCYATVAIRAQRDLDFAYTQWQEALERLKTTGPRLEKSITLSSDLNDRLKLAQEAGNAANIALIENAIRANEESFEKLASEVHTDVTIWSKILVDIAEKRVITLSTHFDRDDIYKIGAEKADDTMHGLVAPNAYTGLSFADDSKDDQLLYPLRRAAVARLGYLKPDNTRAGVLDRTPTETPNLGVELFSAYEDGATPEAIEADTLHNELLTDLEYFQRLVKKHINSTPRIRSQARKARYFWLLEMKLGHDLSNDSKKVLSLIDELREDYLKPFPNFEDIETEVRGRILNISTAITESGILFARELEEIENQLIDCLGRLRPKERRSELLSRTLIGCVDAITSLRRTAKDSPETKVPVNTVESMRQSYFDRVAEYAREATVNKLLGEQLADTERKMLTAREAAEKVLKTYLQILMAEYINLGHNVAQEIYPDDVGLWPQMQQNRPAARLVGSWNKWKTGVFNKEGYLNPRTVPTAETIATNFSNKNFLLMIENTVRLLAEAIISSSTEKGTPEHIRPQLEKVLKMAEPEFRPVVGNTQRLGRGQDVTLMMLLETLLVELIKDDSADNIDRFVLGGLPAMDHLVPGVERAVNLVDTHYEGHLLEPKDTFADGDNLPTIKHAKTPPPIVTGRNQNQTLVFDAALDVRLKNGPEGRLQNGKEVPLRDLFPLMAEMLMKYVDFRKQATKKGTRKLPPQTGRVEI